MCWVDLVLGFTAIDSPDVVEQGLFEETEASAVEDPRMNGIVDYFEADQSYDGGCSGSSGKEIGADLPGLGIGAKLVQEVEGLAFERLVRGRVPGDLDRILDLHEAGLLTVLRPSMKG